MTMQRHSRYSGYEQQYFVDIEVYSQKKIEKKHSSG